MVECHQTSFDDLHTQSMLYFGKTHQNGLTNFRLHRYCIMLVPD